MLRACALHRRPFPVRNTYAISGARSAERLAYVWSTRHFCHVSPVVEQSGTKGERWPNPARSTLRRSGDGARLHSLGVERSE